MSIIGILIGLLSLGLMMLIHEFGHFYTGLKLGFKIEEFSIFMGPRLLSWTKNGIRYSLKLLPIGASVAFDGEYPEKGQTFSADDRERGIFHAMPIWKRACVIFAGPFSNLVSAFLALVIYLNIAGMYVPVVDQMADFSLLKSAGVEVGDELVSINGRTIRNEMDLMTAEQLLKSHDSVQLSYRNSAGELVDREIKLEPYVHYMLGISQNAQSDAPGIEVVGVDPKQNGGQPNLQAGDRIMKVNGIEANSQSLAEALASTKGGNISLEVIRDGSTVKLKSQAIKQEFPNRPLAIRFKREKDFGHSWGYAFNYSSSVVRSTFRLLGEVFHGGIKAKDALSGPVGIVNMYSGIVGSAGIDWGVKLLQVLYLFILISLSLGIMNLLPIPPLDGFTLVLLVVEKIRRKKLSLKTMEVLNFIGFFIIIGLAVVALGFDLLRIFKR
ncbi:MAG: RIP metalloprotease RseP [Eubacteriales bacterium]|nr:RIP metalloprotease RseP [Eubacteriales bacterium]